MTNYKMNYKIQPFILHKLFYRTNGRHTRYEPLAQLVVHGGAVEDPPAPVVDLLAVVLELHVVVEADVPQTHVLELVLRHRPRLDPVGTAEGHGQRGEGHDAAAEPDPGEQARRRGLRLRRRGAGGLPVIHHPSTCKRSKAKCSLALTNSTFN